MSKENLHFDDQSKQAVFCFPSQDFLKEIENMFSVFYQNTCGNFGELKKR